MTAFVRETNVAKELCEYLIAADFGPFLGTPCQLLSPVHTAAHQRVGVLTVTREDNAIGIAAGTSLAGRFPVVLMQNSGLGHSVFTLASLVVPYRIPMLLIVGQTEADEVSEPANRVARLTEPVLTGLGIESATLDPAAGSLADQVDRVASVVRTKLRPAALLVTATALGWQE